MHHLAASELLPILQGFRGARIWVAGDLMLDEYVEGTVSRISPEAPVPVVKVSGRRHCLGGAGNVGHCLAALGARVHLCGVVAADAAGGKLLAACEEADIDTSAVGQSAQSTVCKLRVVAQHQQLLRMDWEDVRPVPDVDAGLLIDRLKAGPRPDAIVISDYAKGFVTPWVARRLIELGRELGVPVLVDPKVDDLSVFRGATVVTPNLGEFAAMAGGMVPDAATQEFADLACTHRQEAGLGALLITLGDRGILVCGQDGQAVTIQSTARDVYDVTGAGDTLIAALALGLAVGADLETASSIANTAAGLAVGQFGNATVTLDLLVRDMRGRPRNATITEGDLLQQVALWRLQGKRAVFTNGCFDVLHAGHLALLRQAAACGDVLVVGINDDASVRRLKGESRPFTPQDERCALVGALDCVDVVTLFSEDTPLRLIEQLQPAVLVKGADYALKDVVGREAVEAAGGKVVLVDLVEERSTTRLIEKAREQGSS
jgi:D-beta-D-heptose 7-phosphate kinase / D-beta-D-heptose 1-phosphate adenosyltransferase